MTADETPYGELVARLDLPTKVRLLTGATMFTLAGEPRIGLEPMAFSDGPTGVRGLTFTGGEAVALFPNATLLASAWDEDAAQEVGGIVADEALRQHIHVVLGPTVNLHRSPLGGRLFEAYSEDPLLTGRIAAGYVRGLQARGVGACPKHLVANEAETQRHTVDDRLGERVLRELYLLPFELAHEAHPWTLMAAYNLVDGVPATEQHHVVEDVVKGEWGWDGLLMSDWFATTSTAASANGGLDLVMPGPDGPWGDALVAAVEAGEVGEEVVDEHLVRLLRLADRVGALGTPRTWPSDVEQPDSPVRREQLTRLAAAGMTVLTNDGTLPLAEGATVALVGRPALDTVTMGGGSAQVNPPYSVDIADGLSAVLGDRLTVVDGVPVRARAVPASRDVTHPGTGEPGVQVVVEDSYGRVLDDRHLPVAQLMVGFDDDYGDDVALVRFRARTSLTGDVVVGALGLGRWEVTAGGTTTTDELAALGDDPGEGVLNAPTTTTTVTLPEGGALVEAVSRPPSGSVGVSGARLLGLVLEPAPRSSDEVLAEAARAAAAADVAVVVVGLTPEQETEAMDKTTLALPGEQDAMVRAVAAAARRTVVVVNAATPVLMPWQGDVDAVLVAGLPGQEGGHAVAAVLTGAQEPTGRLVTSYPAADGASPAWSVTPVDGVLEYTEGTFVGYRGYDAGRAPAPLFWFGHGLGYATWAYGAASARREGADGGWRVSVEVTNTGGRRSREVVQAYLRPAEADQPVRLVGWTAVVLDPGASARVEVACDERLWRRWDEAAGRWARLADGGELLLARGLGDVRARIALG
ncbi:beta-glucosidase family protein [Lapillicoccus jejuensis]|uniref:Beta-glucosidase n=1 Tax=Lapillicoccus jejuensis TaxID=402171 RepID=A0A542E4E8_9MICO|nr:glycoside hydrolase family 3 C-terminal domain-containing protein [Lapillicoccus jejuensis]TQJ10187.1 beta-glucosidase [Lapillicoccus jejuensis]